MKLIDLTCPQCGAQLQLDSGREICFCQYCGAKLLLDNEEEDNQYDSYEAGYEFEMGRQQAQQDAKRQAARRKKQYEETQKKKSKYLWLWVLGWIFIFPVPLTIIVKNKKGPKLNKAIIITLAWILYALFLICSYNNNEDTTQNNNLTETSVSTEYESIK